MIKKGLLLINLGTPDHPDTRSVRRYLAEFLADPRVIDLPATLRYILLYACILPFRSQKSARAYRLIWTKEGSPLQVYSQRMADKVQQHLGSRWQVALGMRYGNPSLKHALNALKHCQELTVLPLFPQYSSAATGSAIEETLRLLQKQTILPSLKVIRDFHQHEGFISAQAKLIEPLVETHEHVLFSFHGIPQRHLNKEGCNPVCSKACPETLTTNSACYRAQCYASAKALARRLGLKAETWSIGFQSRLGKTPWIQPYTDELFSTLAARGIKKLLICCPSFTADCLETLEEIAIRGRSLWLQNKGEQLTLVPCLNDNDQWIEGIQRIISESSP